MRRPQIIMVGVVAFVGGAGIAAVVSLALAPPREDKGAERARLETLAQRVAKLEQTAAMASAFKVAQEQVRTHEERLETLESAVAALQTAATVPLPPDDKRPVWLIPPDDPANVKVVLDEGDDPYLASGPSVALVSADERVALRTVGEGLTRGIGAIDSLSALEDGKYIGVFRDLDVRCKVWEIENTVNCVAAYSQAFPECAPFGSGRTAAQFLGSKLLNWEPGVLGHAHWVWVTMITRSPLCRDSLTDSAARREWWLTKAPVPPKEVLDAVAAAGK